jgi:hypothetical protein
MPAMVLVTVLAFALSFFAAAPGSGAAGGVALLSPGDVGVEGVMFADGRAFSNEEMLDTVLGEGEGEGPR